MIFVACFQKFSDHSLLWSMRSGMFSCMAACFAFNAATLRQTFLCCFFQSILWHFLLQYQTLQHPLQTCKGVGMLEFVTKQLLHKSSPVSSFKQSWSSRTSNSVSANLMCNKTLRFLFVISYSVNLYLKLLLKVLQLILVVLNLHFEFVQLLNILVNSHKKVFQFDLPCISFTCFALGKSELEFQLSFLFGTF